jgi:hypothetical protein
MAGLRDERQTAVRRGGARRRPAARPAQGFIQRSPALRDRLRVKQREITHDALGGRIRVMASDADAFDGVIPTLGPRGPRLGRWAA